MQQRIWWVGGLLNGAFFILCLMCLYNSFVASVSQNVQNATVLSVFVSEGQGTLSTVLLLNRFRLFRKCFKETSCQYPCRTLQVDRLVGCCGSSTWKTVGLHMGTRWAHRWAHRMQCQCTSWESTMRTTRALTRWSGPRSGVMLGFVAFSTHLCGMRISMRNLLQ